MPQDAAKNTAENLDEPSDRDLVARLRAGDQRAFEPLMRRYNRRLFRVARGVTGNDHEAEDVVQETYVRAFTRLEQFTGPDGFGAWMARIALNEALGRHRRKQRVVSLHGGDSTAYAREIEAVRSSLPDPERLADSRELRDLLERAIDGLPDSFRMVFMLRAVEQLNVAECAAVLEIPPETVKTRYHRARLLLREALSDYAQAAAPGTYPFAGQRCDRMVASVLARLGITEPQPSDGS